MRAKGSALCPLVGGVVSSLEDLYCARQPGALCFGLGYREAQSERLKRFRFYRIRLFPNGCGAQGRNRTTDTGIFSPLLYRLSYLGLSGRVCMPHGSGPVKDFARTSPP
jgi:hypothetical protein